MSTNVPKESLRTLVAACAGLPVDVVIWQDEPEGPVVFEQDARRIVLDVVARRRVGRVEMTRSYPDATTVRSTYKGQRVLTISVRAENFGQQDAYDLLEDIVIQLEQPDNGVALNASDLSFNSSTDIRMFEVAADDRAISVGSVDVLLNQTITRVVDTTDPGGYFTSVEMTGQDDLARAGTDKISGPT